MTVNVLEINKINSIIFFQRRFRMCIKKRDEYTKNIEFYKNILISMLSNLTYFNKINIYLETELNFMSFLAVFIDVYDILNRV